MVILDFNSTYCCIFSEKWKKCTCKYNAVNEERTLFQLDYWIEHQGWIECIFDHVGMNNDIYFSLMILVVFSPVRIRANDDHNKTEKLNGWLQ